MANENEKKYAGLEALQALVNECKEIFATKIKVDEAVAEKTQVQIIIWEDDD